ncbi:MAG: glycosyl transferase family 2, partial [Candidatus Zixiibacteriota bacterium]
ISLAVNNSLAILFAVTGKRSQFVRTPKTGSIDKGHSLPPPGYRISFDYTIQIELLLTLYAVYALWCAVSLGLYQTLPFLMTFTFGYVYFSFKSIREWYA